MDMDQDVEVEGKKVDENLMQIVCFRLAGEEYAVPITDIQEVIKPQKATPVPQMPDFVLGAMNLRGNVVAVFDLKKSFALPAKELSDQFRIIVLNSRDSLYSIIVDEILDTLKIEMSALDSLPERKMHIKKECVRGIGLVNNRMIIILDVDKINDELIVEINSYRAKLNGR